MKQGKYGAVNVAPDCRIVVFIRVHKVYTRGGLVVYHLRKSANMTINRWADSACTMLHPLCAVMYVSVCPV